MFNLLFILPLLTAGVITYLITPYVINLATKYKFVDDPKKRYHPAHVHTGIIPRAGGAALFIGSSLCIFLFLGFTPVTIGIFISTAILTVIGLLDDKKDINPYIRLLSNSAAALIIIVLGVGVPYITNPITGGIIHLDGLRVYLPFFSEPYPIMVWSSIFTFFWIMWTINIVGWSAGVDGQMPGFVAIAAFILGLLALRFDVNQPSQYMIVSLAFIICGTFIGFLPWNFFPQKIMPGYGGKTIAGFYLGLLGILSYGKVGTMLLVLGIPTIDALYTLFRRIKVKKSPVWADRGHFHHLLLDLGWGKRKIALFYWFVSAILGIIALQIKSPHKLFTMLLVSVVFVGFLLWIKFFTLLSKQQDQDSG